MSIAHLLKLEATLKANLALVAGCPVKRPEVAMNLLQVRHALARLGV